MTLSGGTIRAALLTWGLGLALVAGGFALALGRLEPPPPDTLRIAVGTGRGADAETVLRWASAMADKGFRVRPVLTSGSLDSLEQIRAGGLDVAIIAGAAEPVDRSEGVAALAAVAREGVFVFVRRNSGITGLGDLRGRAISAGRSASGTRLLALALLGLHGIAPGEMTLPETGGPEGAQQLVRGEVDALVFVAPRAVDPIPQLLADPGIVVLDLASRASAYALALPYLSRTILPAGSVSLTEDVPPRDIPLLAVASVAVARQDLHRLAVTALMSAIDVGATRALFAPDDAFPTARGVRLPLHPTAASWFADGPGPLLRWLPWRVGASIERFWVLLPPLLLLPALWLAPRLMGWIMARRIWRHYNRVRSLERLLLAGDVSALDELGRLEAEVARLPVTAAHGKDLYALREHIAFVRRVAARAGLGAPPASA